MIDISSCFVWIDTWYSCVQVFFGWSLDQKPFDTHTWTETWTLGFQQMTLQLGIEFHMEHVEMMKPEMDNSRWSSRYTQPPNFTFTWWGFDVCDAPKNFTFLLSTLVCNVPQLRLDARLGNSTKIMNRNNVSNNCSERNSEFQSPCRFSHGPSSFFRYSTVPAPGPQVQVLGWSWNVHDISLYLRRKKRNNLMGYFIL